MLNSLIAIDRHERRAVSVLMLSFIITGLGIGKKIMEPKLEQLYESVLQPIVYILLVIDGMIPLRTQFLRWKVVKNEQVSFAYAYAMAMAILALCFWLHFR